MEENVALDSSKQKQFVKSIRGIKKILKVKDKSELKKKDKNNVQNGKIKKLNRKKRGLVYLSHIPHGFYEHQMTQYFKQFGVVTNARVIRSKRTGMSKGYAFVEFKDSNVAQIVAETMNNYLMGKRLIKAAIIPPEKQRKFAKRKHWNTQNNPGNDLRQKMKKAHNSIKDEKEELKTARNLLSNLNRTKKRLRELDIDYEFFTPVDIPEPLLNIIDVKNEEDVKIVDDIKKEDKLKNKMKQEENGQNNKKKKGKRASNIDSIPPKQNDCSTAKKLKKTIEFQQLNDETKLGKASTKKNVNNIKAIKADKKIIKNKEKIKKVERKMSPLQKQKVKKLENEGIKPPENFIQIQNESDNESNSSVDFNSDEYDKVMEQGDSEFESDDTGAESDEDLNDDITSDEDTSHKIYDNRIIDNDYSERQTFTHDCVRLEFSQGHDPCTWFERAVTKYKNHDVENVTSPPKKVVKPSKIKIQATQNKQQSKKMIAIKPSPQSVKRKPPKDIKSSKKPKFEKKSIKKTINKIMKKNK